MRLRSTIGLALRRLRRRPIRSFLLLQGTVWGVGVAIFPVAVLDGTRAAARANAATLGADRISVTVDPTSSRATQLTAPNVERVRKAITDKGIAVHAVGAVHYVRAIEVGPKSSSSSSMEITLLAGTPGCEAARGLRIAQGRALAATDEPNACVVEAGLAQALGTSLEIGSTIRLPGGSLDLEVVGITAPRLPEVLRTNDMGFDTEHPIYKSLAAGFMSAMGAPVVRDEWKRTERCLYVPLPRLDMPVDWIFARVPPDQVREAARAVQSSFAAKDQAVVALHATVLPVVLGKDVDRFGAVNAAMFLACLFMGAVVMANLGLLAAMSRGREVAIRRVEGATQGDIAKQFLVEGFVLAAAGSVMGCFLGMGLARLRVALSPVTGFAWTFPWGQAAIAVGIALILGIAASALPAWRIARLSPTVALADE